MPTVVAGRYLPPANDRYHHIPATVVTMVVERSHLDVLLQWLCLHESMITTTAMASGTVSILAGKSAALAVFVLLSAMHSCREGVDVWTVWAGGRVDRPPQRRQAPRMGSTKSGAASSFDTFATLERIVIGRSLNRNTTLLSWLALDYLHPRGSAVPKGMDLKFYTVREMSEITGMSVDWLWKACRENWIPDHKRGRPYGFTDDDLLALRTASAVPVKAVLA